LFNSTHEGQGTASSPLVSNSCTIKGNNLYNLTCLYQNTRGLRSKTSDFYLSICNLESSVVAISETWLSSDVLNSEIFPTNWSVYRSDRNFEACGKCRGGGVLLAHKDELISRQVLLSTYDFPLEIDVLCVTFHRFTNSVSYIIVYVPPHTALNTYNAFLDSLSTLLTSIGNEIVLIGDFNTPHLDTPADPRSHSLRNFVEFCDLLQHNFIRNAFNRTLDLVFTNSKCSVTRSNYCLVDEDPFHPSLLIKTYPASPLQTLLRNNNTRLNFKRADFPNLYKSIASIDWSLLDSCNSVDTILETFYELIMVPINMFVPAVSTNCKPLPTWFTPEIIKLMKQKEKSRQKFKKTNCNLARENYKLLRIKIKEKLSTSYQNFVSKAIESFKTTPNKFWSFVNSKRNTSRIPGVMIANGKTVDNPEHIVNCFANQFASVYSHTSKPHITFPDGTAPETISITEFTEQDIIKACNSLKANLTMGKDNIPAFLVRDCAHVLARPLKTIFNAAILNNTFPGLWKTGNICPIFKSGDRSDISNYRPIALLSNFSKVFERAIYN
jgi:hypothetical protein